MNFGKIEIALLIIAVILVLFVGGKKLPELARGIGQAGKELKKGFKDDEDDKEKVEKEKTDKK